LLISKRAGHNRNWDPLAKTNGFIINDAANQQTNETVRFQNSQSNMLSQPKKTT